jgi:hypothetical protein
MSDQSGYKGGGIIHAVYLKNVAKHTRKKESIARNVQNYK